MRHCRSITKVLCALLVGLGSPVQVWAVSVTLEAESGTVGAYWAVSNSANPAYVTILQYCMVQGRDYLQGSLYTNLMSTRTCPDVFDTNNWTTFIYGSRIAQAMGIWPWSDVFRSAATRNLLLSTLSPDPSDLAMRSAR